MKKLTYSLSIRCLRKTLSISKRINVRSSMTVRQFSLSTVACSADLPKSIAKSIPKYIIDFVKKESNYIKESLVSEDLDYMEESEGPDIPEHVKASLDASVDDYNKLLTLLSFNPSDIPSSLYLHYLYDKDIEFDENIKQLFVCRLTFHQLFDHIWRSLVDENSTINDLETIVESIGKVLVDNNNLYVGVLSAVLSSQTHISNEAYHSVIIDCFCHDFSVNKKDLSEAVALSQGSHNLNYVNSNNKFVYLVHLRRIFYNDGALHHLNTNITGILASCELVPGWFSFATEKTPLKFDKSVLIDIFATAKSTKLNDYDLKRVQNLNILSPVDYLFFFQNYYSPNTNRVSWALDLFTRDFITGNDEAMLLFLQKSHDVLSNDTLGKILLNLYSTKLKYFHECFDCILHYEGPRDYSPVIQIILDEYKAQGDLGHQCRISFHEAVLMTSTLSTFDDNLRLHIPVRPFEQLHVGDLYLQFVKTEKTRSRNLLQILRGLLVENGIVNQDLIREILCITILKPIQIMDNGSVRILHKNKFHNTVRSLSQLLSELSHDLLQQSLNICISAIKTSKSFENIDKSFCHYLIKTLVFKTLAFRYRKKSLDFSLLIQNIDMPSKAKEYMAAFFRIQIDPYSSLIMVETNRQTKSKLNKNIVNAIEAGILGNKALNINERIGLYREFRKHLESCGFKSKASTENITLLIQLLLKTPEISTNSAAIDKILAISIKHKVPQRLINKWVKHQSK